MTVVPMITLPTLHGIGWLNSMLPPQTRSDSDNLSPHTCLNILIIAMARGVEAPEFGFGL